jgi:hypothetical protein
LILQQSRFKSSNQRDFFTYKSSTLLERIQRAAAGEWRPFQDRAEYAD